MNIEDQDGALVNGKAAPKNAATRKPYKPPSFQHERVFETMALACGKVQPTQRQCFFNRKRS